MTAPSHCTDCNHKLSWKDLIPVLSYIFVKGRCRYCKDKISIRYPLIELLTGIVFIMTFFHYGVSIQFFSTIFLFSALIAISFIDIKHRIIPDGIIITLIVAGVFFNIINSEITWIDSLIGFFAASVPLLTIALVSKGGMGGGDIKLMAAAGLFLGWRLILLSLFISSIIGAVIGIGLVLLGIKKRKDTLPFGPFLSLGIMISLLYGGSIIKWYLGHFY